MLSITMEVFALLNRQGIGWDHEIGRFEATGVLSKRRQLA